MFRIHSERPDDADEVELLFDLTFGPGRTALSSYRLREGVAPLAGLCCVARDEFDALVGAVRFWPVVVGVRARPAVLLGPIAVHPTRHGEGLGALLMMEGLSRARDAGWRCALLVGDAPYYRRFGFERMPVEFPPPTNPDRVLGLALVPGGLEGIEGAVDRWPDAPSAVASEG